jgi:hypothetical protein
MAVMVTRQERHFEPSMCRVLGANKKPKAESADRESPSRGVVAAPMADEPSDDEGDQIHTRLCHIVVFRILRWAQVDLSVH